MKKFSLILVSILIMSVSIVEAKSNTILFILDVSGSMAGKLNSGTRMDAAKKTFIQLLEGLPRQGLDVGLEVYGHYGVKDCSAIEVIVPPRPLDPSAVKTKVEALSPDRGATPIADALATAGETLRGLGKKTIVLISDGKETCGGNPVATAKRIRKEVADVVIHVIGFAVSDKERTQLEAIAKAGKGRYYTARNARQLKESLVEIKEEVVKEEPKKEPLKDIFIEEFDKTFLSEDWDIVNDNSDGRVLEDGIFYIISAPGSFSKESVQNMLLYNKPIEQKNYEVVTKFKVPLTNYGNSADGQQWNGLIFYANKDNIIGLVVHGFYGYFTGGSGNARLAQFFKIQGGKWATSFNTPVYRGKNTDLQPYYLKIEKKKFKYTAYYSTDGQKWNKIGTIAILGKKLKPGIFAVRGNNAQEVVVEFDSFRIKELE